MVGRPRPMRGIQKTLIAAILGVFLAVPVPAFAGSAQDAYDIPGGSIQEELEQPRGNVPGNAPGARPGQPGQPGQPSAEVREAQAQGGNLPFTGLDLGLMVGVGGILLALGLGMRRLSRSSEPV
jgi:hypothetical protein